MSRHLTIGAVLAILAGMTGCPQKVPYPSQRKSPSAATPPAGLRDLSGSGAESAADRLTPEPPSEGPSWHGALVWTPEGTIRLKAGPAGKSAASRMFPLQWWRVVDGVGRGVRIEAEGKRIHPRGKESRLLRVRWLAGGRERELPLEAWVQRPDLDEVGRADPDLAPEFFHREQMTPIGALGGRLVLLLSVDGFLGGAHPYAVRQLLVLDVERGEWVEAGESSEQSALARAALGPSFETTCLRRPIGLVEMGGTGGRVHRILGLAHEIESCAGRLRLLDLDRRPGGESPGGGGPDPEGRWALEASVVVAPVLDFRQQAGTRWTVLLMGRDRGDRLPPPEKAAQPDLPRELRWWEPGMTQPLSIGRGARILEVQFLEELSGDWAGIPGNRRATQGSSGGRGGGIGDGS